MKKCYKYGKVDHIAKYCRTERKKEINFLIEEVEEEIRILLMTRSSDAKLPSWRPNVKWHTRFCKGETLTLNLMFF